MWGIRDRNRILLPPLYDAIWSYSRYPDKQLAVKYNNLYGVFDSNFRPLTDIEYYSVQYLYMGQTYLVNKNGLYGMIDLQGRTLIPVQYDSIEHLSLHKDSLYAVRQNNKKGLYKYDKLIVPPLYDFIYGYSVFRVGVNGKEGLLDSMGRTIIPCRYDNLHEIQGKTAVAKLNGKYGVLRDSNILIPFCYDYIRYNEGVFYLHEAGKWGAVDEKGATLLPVIYQFQREIMPNFSLRKGTYIHDNKKWYYIDRYGNKLPGY